MLSPGSLQSSNSRTGHSFPTLSAPLTARVADIRRGSQANFNRADRSLNVWLLKQIYRFDGSIIFCANGDDGILRLRIFSRVYYLLIYVSVALAAGNRLRIFVDGFSKCV